MDTKQYIETNKDRFLEELFELIRIPSISSQSEHKEDMVRCAEKWKEFILAAGADKAEVMPSAGNPLVYAEKHVSDIHIRIRRIGCESRMSHRSQHPQQYECKPSHTSAHTVIRFSFTSTKPDST